MKQNLEIVVGSADPKTEFAPLPAGISSIYYFSTADFVVEPKRLISDLNTDVLRERETKEQSPPNEKTHKIITLDGFCVEEQYIRRVAKGFKRIFDTKREHVIHLLVNGNPTDHNTVRTYLKRNYNLNQVRTATDLTLDAAMKGMTVGTLASYRFESNRFYKDDISLDVTKVLEHITHYYPNVKSTLQQSNRDCFSGQLRIAGTIIGSPRDVAYVRSALIGKSLNLTITQESLDYLPMPVKSPETKKLD